jgi:bacillithiol biosynthesis cysteine-adding enzyme BshC
MSTECYPIATLPHTTKLFRDYLAMGDAAPGADIRGWYGADPLGGGWMRAGAPEAGKREALAAALHSQSISFGAGDATLVNIAKLGAGARAVVTGQQVGLLGGPLLTLLKAATAVARAKQATAATGVDHVPVFWLATEDHDVAEVDQVSLLGRSALETRGTDSGEGHPAAPVGGIGFSHEIDSVLKWARELLGFGPICDLLQECYGCNTREGSNFGAAFGRLMTKLFAAHGLIVMDASGPDLHALGAATLRYAIDHAAELETALLTRARQLEDDGYHAQVLVKAGASLLFLISDIDHCGGCDRQALRRTPDGTWRAGTKSFSTSELLDILEAAPERLSPNALLRAVFQDTILPTAAYVGGPAEVAYFAQSSVLYEKILGRITPVLPRLTATLIEPEIGAVMAQHEVTLPDAMTTAEALGQRLGARAMPIESKRRLAAAGNALDAALTAAEEYLGGMDEGLGRSIKVSGSKMRYQMNRLRRLGATYELNKEAGLRRHAEAITLHLFPNGHPQERVVAGAWFLARYGTGNGVDLVARLVTEAANQCPGHVVIRL